MMGRLNHDQRQLFYSFCLDEVLPDDHLVRAIASVLDPQGTGSLLFHDRPSFDRSGAHDPDAGYWLRICDPLGASIMPRCAGEPGPPVVLRPEH